VTRRGLAPAASGGTAPQRRAMAGALPARFKTPAAFRAWLRKHHKTANALVLRVAKRHAAAGGVTYSQALDEALCYGWIDGVRRRLDADSFSVRFTPRKPGSIWSRVNVGHVERLVRAKRMTKAGLAVFEAREERRTGIYSFEQRKAGLAPAFRQQFQKHKAAWTWFQQEAPWYRRTSSFWVMSAKRDETRVKRLETLIACAASGTRIPPLRRS
jgi:uncharacterized protein YdeI (YjbR/CyaY-like superfamily)